MDKLILENVRCFRDRHEIPLAPLTLIVGENSTGKSTLLAAARSAWDLEGGWLHLNFNEDPFDWGAHDQITHCAGGRAGRGRTFSLGYESSEPRSPRFRRKKEQTARIRFVAELAAKGIHPQVSKWRMETDKISITTTYKEDLVTGKSVVEYAERRYEFGYRHFLESGHVRAVVEWGAGPLSGLPQEVVNELEKLSFGTTPWDPRPHAIAPIRSKPRRTYDRRSELPQPEGGHVPMILAAMKSSNPKEWQELRDALKEFGVESGLFKNIDIKRLGTKDSDPFQVRIRALGPAANLVDVGYGVSQILPVAVDCLTAERGQMLLMQQPEVHLHPRAQAQLGTFLGYMVKRRRNRFMIETHSDYLIDRVRLDVRDGKNLRPQDVSLLYCERNKIGVNVHQIEIDSRGNLVNAPPGYRSFFLEEEKRFFGE